MSLCCKAKTTLIHLDYFFLKFVWPEPFNNTSRFSQQTIHCQTVELHRIWNPFKDTEYTPLSSFLLVCHPASLSVRSLHNHRAFHACSWATRWKQNLTSCCQERRTGWWVNDSLLDLKTSGKKNASCWRINTAPPAFSGNKSQTRMEKSARWCQHIFWIKACVA